MSRYMPGDIVSRRKGFVMHKGVVLNDGRILHNTPFKGEHACSEADFRDGKRLHVTRQDAAARRRARRWADEDSGRGYNLFTNNCEHTVSRASHGRAESPQLRSWVAGIAVGAAAFVLTRHPGITAAGYVLGRSVAKRF